jgi:hypothetical protein
MNFVSHHCFQSTSSGLYNAGLILADLIPLAQVKRTPLLPVVRDLVRLRSLPEEQMPIFYGLNAHFKADRIFHHSEFFLSAVDTLSKEIMITRAIPPVLHHVLIEMCMDKFLVMRDSIVAGEMYDSFARSYNSALEIISPHVPIGTEVISICEKFSSGRIICRYTDSAIFVGRLKFIANNVGIRFDESDMTTDAAIAAYDLLSESIAAYFVDAKDIYRKIEADIE